MTPSGSGRLAMAWALLGAVVVLIVGLQLANYFQQSDRAEGDAAVISAAGAQARLTLGLAELAQRGDAGASGQLTKPLATSWKELEEKAARSADAARAWVPVAHELGLKIPPDPIRQLAKSKQEGDQALAELYSGKAPTRPVGVGMPGFAGELARYHAGLATGKAPSRAELFPPARMLGALALLGGFATALVAGFALLLVFLASAKKLRQAGYPGDGLSQEDAARRALRMAAYLLLYFSLMGLLVRGIPLALPTMVKAMLGALAFAWLLVVLLRTPVWGRGDPAMRLLGETKPLGKLVLAGVWAWLAVLPLVLASAALLTRLFPDLPSPSHPTTVEVAGGQGGWEVLATYALVAALAPFLEELTFRGLLFPALKRHMGWVAAAALSGLVFAAIHPQGPLLWPSLGLLGLAGAASAQYTGSLVPAMVMHGLNNAAVLTLALVLLQ